MNSMDHFEDEDLALYAMGALAEPESSAVARQIAEIPEARRRYDLVRGHLAVYAEASLELQPAPAGSLNRLMSRVAQEKKVVAISPPAAFRREPPDRLHSYRSSRTAATWIGWAIAAGMAVIASRLYYDGSSLHRELAADQGQLAQRSAELAGAQRERNLLRANVSDQTSQIAQLSGETEAVRSRNEALRSKVEGQSEKLDIQAEQTAQARHDRDILQQTAAAEADQVAELATNAAKAREVVEALTDRTALQVTMTKPKKRAAPFGHTTYVASRGTLVFLASNLSPLKSNKVYQLWLMPANGSGPVPAGTFTPDARGNASLIYEHFPRAIQAAGFTVTVENAGGSAKPTLPIILAGKPSRLG